MRKPDLYAQIMGVKETVHPDYEMTSPKGLKVKLSWDKKYHEYRAWKWAHGGWMEMKLGSTFPESLQEHIEKYY